MLSTQLSRTSGATPSPPVSHLKFAEISLQHVDNACLFNRPFRSLCIACNNFVTHRLPCNDPLSPAPSPTPWDAYPSGETPDANPPVTDDAGTSVALDGSFETAQLYIPDSSLPPTAIPIPSSLRCPFCDDAQWCSLACAQSGLQWFQFNSQFRCMVLFQSS